MITVNNVPALLTEDGGQFKMSSKTEVDGGGGGSIACWLTKSKHYNPLALMNFPNGITINRTTSLHLIPITSGWLVITELIAYLAQSHQPLQIKLV